MDKRLSKSRDLEEGFQPTQRRSLNLTSQPYQGSSLVVRMHPNVGYGLPLFGEPRIMCTGGEYRGVLHDQHFQTATMELSRL
jgi:hypothetical protein